MPAFTVADLEPMDVIQTNIVPDFSLIPHELIEYLASHTLIQAYQNDLYPDGIGNDTTHIRMVLGDFVSPPDGTWVTLGFEWTFPFARIFVIQPWMVKPENASVLRLRPHLYTSEGCATHLLQRAVTLTGTPYNALQLLGMGLGIRGLQFSGKSEVCSTGIRREIEDFTGIKPLFPEVDQWRTPPASFSNHPELFQVMNRTE